MGCNDQGEIFSDMTMSPNGMNDAVASLLPLDEMEKLAE